MNLPNRLTILRVILIPVFLLFMYLDCPFHYTIALLVFAAASLTDAFDGHIARKRGLVTDFGKFLDPLADKALVMAALAVFVDFGYINSIPLIIIVAREFMVSGLRLVTAGKGVVVAAGFWGKLKTAFTLAAILLILLLLSLENDMEWFGLLTMTEGASPDGFRLAMNYIALASIWASAALTVISGCVYLKGYWKYIDSEK